MERVTDTNKAEGVRSIHDTMLAKQHLCHGVHEHRQQSHRLDLIEELSVALRPVRMGEGVLVVALDSLKLLLSAAGPMDPGKAHKVSQSVRVVTWHVDVDVGDLVVESRAIALDKEFDNAFAARGGPKIPKDPSPSLETISGARESSGLRSTPCNRHTPV